MLLDRGKYILFALGLLFPFHHFLICCAILSETWTWNLVVKNKQLSWHNNIDFQPSRKKRKFSVDMTFIRHPWFRIKTIIMLNLSKIDYCMKDLQLPWSHILPFWKRQFLDNISCKGQGRKAITYLGTL